MKIIEQNMPGNFPILARITCGLYILMWQNLLSKDL